jgi:hypothetical protein
MVKVNVPMALGATTASDVVARRFALIHPTAISLNATESLTTPRLTCLPAMPRCQVVVPVLRNRIE